MPADDLVLNVRQIAGYPEVGSAAGANTVLMQQGGLGGPYASIEADALVGTALQGSTIPLQLGVAAPADAAGGQIFTDAVITPLGGWFGWNAYGNGTGLPSLIPGGGAARLVYTDTGWVFQAWTGAWTDSVSIGPEGGVSLNPGQSVLLGRDPTGGLEAATAQWVLALIASVSAVTSFMGRTGAIVLNRDDIILGGGAPIASPYFVGCPRGPTPEATSNSSRLATTAYVQAAIAAVLAGEGVVMSFNGRQGAVTLTAADVVAANPPFAPLASPNFSGNPTAPTPAAGVSDGQIATTAFVQNAVTDSTTGVVSFNGRTGLIVLTAADLTGAGGALLASPVFTGTPSGPTPPPGDSSTRLATTAFVNASGPYAPLNSPAFVGTPTAPTPATGNNSTQLATTAFVMNEINAVNAGVISFNGRTGAVSLIANDISAAGGAILVSPAFTGVPTAPTAAAGVSTTQIATTAFVTSALAALSIPVASSGNPLMNGAAAPGVSALYSRGDHVHPSDTSRLPIAGGTMTGALFAPNATITNALTVNGQGLFGAPVSVVTTLSVTDPAAHVGVNINGNSTFNRQIQALTGGVLRWTMMVADATPEGGADTGSSFNLQNCHDTGVAFDNPLNINRATSVATFSHPINNGSDRRIKLDVAPLKDALASVLKLQGVRYTRIGAKQAEIGLIAQDVLPVVPEVVHPSPAPLGPNGRAMSDGGEPFLGITYGQLTALLIEAVKELTARVAGLEAAT
jgi:hypothetical protein